MKEYAAVEWQRARRALESARQLAGSDPDSAASRAYYAAFHALTALFALRGLTFSKHAAIRAALHKELVHPRQIPQELGRDYDFLMELREIGDYGGMEHVTRDDGRAAVKKADGFISALAKACPDLGSL